MYYNYYDDQFCDNILENKQNLLKFWAQVDHQDRLFYLKGAEQDFNQIYRKEKEKEKEKVGELPMVYQKFKGEYIKTDGNGVQEYFQKYLERERDYEFIEKVFFADLEMTTTIYPFIYRILLKKLQYQFTNKMA